MIPVRLYDESDGYVEYIIKDDVIYGTAHSNNKTYSKGMLRAIKKGIAIKGKIVTELRYNYLIAFYSRHYELTLIKDNYYEVKEI